MPKENERDYEDLFNCHHELQRQYRSVVQKHKASLQKIKRLSNEVATLKLRLQALPSSEMDISLRKASDSHQEMDEKEKGDLLEVISKRLTEAEKNLHLLRLEKAVENASNNDSEKKKSDGDSQIQIARLKTHLHELATQHKLDALRLSLQEEKLRKILTLHNQYVRRHAMLKKELRFCESERNQMEEYKEEVFELREQNHFLEKHVTKLCSIDSNEEEIQMLKNTLLQKESGNEILLEEIIKLQGENERLRLMLRQSDKKATEIKSCYRELEHLALEEAKSIDSSNATS
ncbi:hypothetical protein ACHAWT_005757 [Skeletonema menzelii]